MGARHRSRKGLAGWQRATAVVPLALLAGAWTASLGSVTTAVADSGHHGPGIPAVPTTAFDSPASYTVPRALGPNSLNANPHNPGSATNPAGENADGIPTAAMLAYQRAEAVLRKADPSCHVSWALVAAIGRVESDHGRYGGNVLRSNGESVPGIYGPRLDGSHGTVLVKDTDNGGYDHDPTYDRAVGAMQFIPGTWEVVGVDGDGNGVRDPQDIDDAALATAVYLCAGNYDLSTAGGQRSAVFAYNHSKAYVDLVLSIMRAYQNGNYTQVADGIPTSTYIPPIPAPTRTQHQNPDRPHPRQHSVPKTHGSPHLGASGPTASNPNNNGPGTQSNPRINNGPATNPGSNGPGTNGPGTNGPGTNGPVTNGPGTGNPPPTQPSTPSAPTVTAPNPTTPLSTPSNPVATVTKPVQSGVDPVVQATQVCQAAFASAGLNPTSSQLSQCISAYKSGGQAAVNALIAALTAVPTVSLPTPSLPLPGQ